MNDSVMGLGYLAARVRGRIEMADAIKGELTSKGIKAGARPILSLLDTADSFLRLVFKTDNKTIAKIRRLIGFADMERAFAKADMIHAMTWRQSVRRLIGLKRKAAVSNRFGQCYHAAVLHGQTDASP